LPEINIQNSLGAPRLLTQGIIRWKLSLAERGPGFENWMNPKGTGAMKAYRLEVRVRYKRHFSSPEHSDLIWGTVSVED